MSSPMTVALLGALTFGSAAAALTPAPVNPDSPAPLIRHYRGEALPLALDPGRVAVFIDGDEAGDAARNAAQRFGFTADDVRSRSIPGYSFVSTGRASEAATRGLLDELAADPGLDFVSPVFLDGRGNPMNLTPDVMVRFHADVSREAALAALEKAIPGGAVRDIDWAGMPNAYRVRSASRNGLDVLEQANELARDARTSWSEVDWQVPVYPAEIPTDPSFPGAWQHQNTGQTFNGGCIGWNTADGVLDMDMDTTGAWDLTTGNPTVVVAVFDNGVHQTNPDINQLPGYDFVNPAGNGGPVTACDGHGTFVAGCISAIMNNGIGTVGVAPDCPSVSMKVWNSGGDGCSGAGLQWSWVIDGLAIAEAIGVRVTNHSYSWSSSSQAVEDQFFLTRQGGMVHFASAGNGGADNTGDANIAYPASIEWVNAVGALEPDGSLAGYSNFGSPGTNWPQEESQFITAPGSQVSTPCGASGNACSFCGTSAASPNAAGVAALVISANPALTAVEVEAFMAMSAMDLGAGGYDTVFGFGFVNAQGAVLAALEDAYGEVCGGGGGSCYESHNFPGCSVNSCCLVVCVADPFCCNIEWDNICADQAISLCLGCPGEGPCNAPHATPGCDDVDCCGTVCALDPLCCDVEWDIVCVNIAADLCGGCPNDQPCDQPHQQAGCNDAGCCAEVCSIDPLCCDVEWDIICVEIAIEVCNLSPENDNCQNAIEIGNGTTPFSVTNASSDGEAHEECEWITTNDQGITVTKDVWFHYTAECTGYLTVSTCGDAPFQTWLGVYRGTACPPTFIDLIDCESDTPGCSNGTATLSNLFVNEGEVLTIRVGAKLPIDGGGTLTVSCEALFDSCAFASEIEDFTGTLNVNTNGATTDGPAHLGCISAGQTLIQNDIWFDWIAPCTGNATISTCDDVDFNSWIAVYTGWGCPVNDDRLVGCNNDSNECGGDTSVLTVPVLEGKLYKIRLGGYGGDTGNGSLTIDCEPVDGPDADLDGDGDVDGADLGLLLGDWGPCPGCPADINGDGVVDGADLGMLLAQWGDV